MGNSPPSPVTEIWETRSGRLDGGRMRGQRLARLSEYLLMDHWSSLYFDHDSKHSPTSWKSAEEREAWLAEALTKVREAVQKVGHKSGAIGLEGGKSCGGEGWPPRKFLDC